MWGRIISTHALTEGDRVACFNGNFTGISTHALTEGDCAARMFLVWSAVFQLTPSRRATSRSLFLRMANSHFNSRPHGGRPTCRRHFRAMWYFNSRPHGGRLHVRDSNGFPEKDFNSRPHGGRHDWHGLFDVLRVISTHALTEGDLTPVSPLMKVSLFQLTPSRRATQRRF